jgi:hypothetical protein
MAIMGRYSPGSSAAGMHQTATIRVGSDRVVPCNQVSGYMVRLYFPESRTICAASEIEPGCC